MVPDEWTTSELGNRSIHVIDGDRGKSYPSAGQFFDEGHCLFLSAKNVTKRGFAFDETQFVSEKKHNELRKGELTRGDIILTTRGTVGNTAYYNKDVPFDVVRINSGMVIIRNSDHSVSSEFLDLLFRSKVIQNQVNKMTFGSAQPQLTVGIIKRFKIPLPPLPEQHKIADILSTWDRAIETTGALLATARTQKRALMQSLLTGKRRFPEFEGQDWKEVRLGSLGTFRKGKGLPKGDVGPEGRFPCVLYGELYTTYGEVIHEPVSRTDVDDGFVGEAGDVLVPASTTTSGIDLAIASCVLKGGVRLGGDINIFRATTSVIDGQFLAYFLTHARRNEMARFAQGITIVHLKGGDLLDLKILVPPIKEQQKIISLVYDVEQEVRELIQAAEKLRTEKKALMQQLLTGKRRVVV